MRYREALKITAASSNIADESLDPAPLSFWKRARNVFTGSIEEWISQRAASKGAALAFYTLFSMAPILVLVIAIAGAIFGVQAAQGEIFAQLADLVGPNGAQAVQLLLAGARNPDDGLVASIVAGIFLLIGATTAFSELKDSLDEIWHVPTSRQSGLSGVIRTRLLSFGLVLMLAFLLLVSLVISAGLAVLERYWNRLGIEVGIMSLFASLFSFGVIACLFAVIYKMLPQIRLSWRDVWIGAVGTAALFDVGKYAIGVYLGNSGVANSYGAAGSILALLLWVYYSAQIFFLGAEFTRQYAIWFGSLRSPMQHPAKIAGTDPAGEK
ncbi:MAG: putative ribonuclease [Herminiimonas sp.]|nr:putative ribonuclease [Herminiimonas sp.]